MIKFRRIYAQTHRQRDTRAQCFFFLSVLSLFCCQFHFEHNKMWKIPSHDEPIFDNIARNLLFAAFNKSLISLMILLICCDVLSNSFSCLLRFSRNSGLSRRQSANSSAAKLDPPLITIALNLHQPVLRTHQQFFIFLFSLTNRPSVRLSSLLYTAIKYLRLYLSNHTKTSFQITNSSFQKLHTLILFATFTFYLWRRWSDFNQMRDN